MPTIFTAGTPAAGVYPGVAIATPTALLTELANTFTAAGQTVTDEISANSRIVARGVDQGNFCDKIYTVVNVTGIEYKLTIQGDNTVNSGILMPTPLEIPFFANGNAALYVAADEGAECLTIFNPGATSKGIHAGWLDRRRATDVGAWMVGYLDIWLTNAFFAQDYHGIDWRECHTYFSSSTESQTSPKGAYQHIWDSGCAAVSGAIATSATNTSFNHKVWRGQNDPISGEPTLLPYGYLQGEDVYNGYDSIDPNQGQGLHNPGFVRFARNGLAFMDAGDQCHEGTATFVSAGGSGDDAFQGFQIAV